MNISFEEFKRQVLNDYKNVCLGRELRQAAAKERSIGSFTACSDVAQVALSKQFCETDWHTSAGIDTTFEIAAGIISPLDFFRRLYFSDFDLRMAASTLHLPQAAGLALASKIYRANPEMADDSFATDGNSVSFCTIGSRFVTDGYFLETVYTAAAQQIPLVVVLWNNTGEYSNGNLMKQISGFVNLRKNSQAIILQSVKGYDYPALCRTFEQVAGQCRSQHVPVVVCVEGCADDAQCMKSWIVDSGLATERSLADIERACTDMVAEARKTAYYKALLDEKVAPVRHHSDNRCEGLARLLLDAHRHTLVLDELPNVLNKAIGLAMRGLRPVVSVQAMSEVTVSNWAKHRQSPIIVRTQDTAVGSVLYALPQTIVAVPHDMQRAAAVYKWLLLNSRAGVVVEPVERADLRNADVRPLAPGGCYVAEQGTDVTLVCYGNSVRPALDAARMLRERGHSAEVVVAETLNPLDTAHVIGDSVRRTRLLAVADVDPSGGASAYVTTRCLSKQNVFESLRHQPVSILPPEGSPSPAAADICARLAQLFHQ